MKIKAVISEAKLNVSRFEQYSFVVNGYAWMGDEPFEFSMTLPPSKYKEFKFNDNIDIDIKKSKPKK